MAKSGPKPRKPRVRVDPHTGCWEWLGGRSSPVGYGYRHIGDRKQTLAHRYIYALEYGPLARDQYIHHRCGNKGCVNIWHLELTDHAGNMRARGKLDPEKVARMREMHQSGARHHEIAHDFGVAEGTVRDVIGGRSWKGI